jgi:arylsulfatase A-like enzyme
LAGKGFPYTESVEVPAFMRWPEAILAGTREERLVANIDIVPTILDAIGLSPDTQLDGRSLMDPSWQRERLLIEGWSRHETPTWAGLISLEESYVEYYGSDGTTIEFREFYDLQEDPYQMTNLLGDPDPLNDPSDADTLSSELAQARMCSGEDCP